MLSEQSLDRANDRVAYGNFQCSKYPWEKASWGETTARAQRPIWLVQRVQRLARKLRGSLRMNIIRHISFAARSADGSQSLAGFRIPILEERHRSSSDANLERVGWFSDAFFFFFLLFY